MALRLLPPFQVLMIDLSSVPPGKILFLSNSESDVRRGLSLWIRLGLVESRIAAVRRIAG